MTPFGDLLRQARHRCLDPERRRRLTQERLGQMLGEALGVAGYSGAAVSEWERGKSKVHADQREVLVCLVQVLHRCGGLGPPAEANALLLAGNYRPLDEVELRRAFTPLRAGVPPAGIHEQRAPAEPYLRPGPAQAGPRAGDADWPARLLDALGAALERWPAARVLRAGPWLGIWYLTWKGALVLCDWPISTPERAWAAVLLYVVSALAAPPLVALAARYSAGRPVWEVPALARERWAHLYTLLGAMAGYHTGYMMVFAVALAARYLEFGPLPPWALALLAVWPPLLGCAAARRVPVNQLRAVGRLRPGVGELAILVGFGLFGLWWGGFYYLSYKWLLEPATGLPLVAAAAAGAALLALWRGR